GNVAVQVNRAAAGGQPDFIVSGFNQENSPIEVTQPRVYFGEPPPNSPEFVVANSKQGEYDAPSLSGEATKLFNYDGPGGVQLSDVGRRLAFAVRFRDINLLISGNIKNESRLMFNRDIRDRVERAAPFLQWDGDPYAVVVDGRIKYVRDGYTTSSNYPYAQRIDLADAARRNELGSRGVEGIGNYIRNSVKAVVDAYTGEVTLYAFDETDPILAAWRKAFPDLFAAKSEISESLNSHLRYPEDLFSIQTWIYASYHIGDPDQFYAKEDFWALPDDRSGEIRRQEDTGGLAAATSVKAVVDAYTGDVTLYAFDESDPILQAWRKAFPDLFAPKSEISETLNSHLRYPEDLFSIQTWIYASYHIRDPDQFYAKEDFWALPDDRSGEIRRQEDTGGLAAATSAKARPYYLLTKLPGRDAPEYVLVMPFTPNGKENMVSYLAAEADPDKYGQLTLYSLDRSRTILGPTQVNARILATPEVSREVSLLNQQGSRVILSNLLVVPVDESLLYVQPIFVQGSAPNSFPLLQKVAVFYNNEVG
ncbi:MAG TPA: UPF0182 family protein, partial [Propionibacteriaceae bacterium]|nr:UPF0182 family protein [Propionibacteriaceae bacterium]